jgi:hypothetical protein
MGQKYSEYERPSNGNNLSVEHSSSLLRRENNYQKMTACHKAFLSHYPWLTEKYEDFNVWLFSEDPTCVAFRRGWAACNDYRNR